MRIVFVGDIFGRSGREALAKHLPTLKEKLSPDIVIVNGENAANGRGITEKICKEFYDLGVNVITSGNHIWDQREILAYIDRDKTLLRPLNFPKGTQGNGSYIFETAGGQKICVVNVMARLFMDPLDDPFQSMSKMLQTCEMGKDVHAIFVDFHGEATSEKMALAHFLDGKVSAVVGTHTHIPTADAHVLKGGTAFQCDAGMTGDYDSVIGVMKEIPVRKFTRKVPGQPMKPASGEAMLCGIYIETDDNTGLAKRIEPIRIGEGLSAHMPQVEN